MCELTRMDCPGLMNSRGGDWDLVVLFAIVVCIICYCSLKFLRGDGMLLCFLCHVFLVGHDGNVMLLVVFCHALCWVMMGTLNPNP